MLTSGLQALPFCPFTARMTRSCSLSDRALSPVRRPTNELREGFWDGESDNETATIRPGTRELVRLLESYAKAQTGPFSWRFLHEGRELGLYLIVNKSNKDGFECLVKTILRRRPGSGFLAEDGEPVATLHGTRVREGETLVLIKCPNPKTIGSIFVNVALGMEALQKELAKPTAEPEHQVQIRVESVSSTPAQTAATAEKPPQKPREPDAVAVYDELSPPPGRPSLDHDELIYRLAKAQEGEDLKAEDPRESWKWIARQIKWNPGSDEPGLALLRDARQRLHRLKPGDPLLAEVAAWRKARETKET